MMNNFRYENKTKVYFGKGSVGESLGGGSVSDCCKVVSAQADFAFLDPGYSLSVPFRQVVSGAFDTLSHAMETYFGKPDENNLSDDINEAVMRSVIRNIRALLADHDNYEARSELAWASSMAENGILKIGKVTDFQCHMLEHQLGAYTNCNHGAGLAVLHPALYRHLCPADAGRFARFSLCFLYSGKI